MDFDYNFLKHIGIARLRTLDGLNQKCDLANGRIKSYSKIYTLTCVATNLKKTRIICPL